LLPALESTSSAQKPVRYPMLASIGLHALFVGLILWLHAPVYLQPQSLMRGKDGQRSSIAVLTAGISAPPLKTQPDDSRTVLRVHKRPKKKAAPKPDPRASAEQTVANAQPGSAKGSSLFGLSGYHDVRVAYLTYAPDPPIDRQRLPEWVRGDVVVEVTIDEKGAVVQTKLLQSVGFGLDDVILETLRQWRFQPAKVDGVPVSSKHDVHFHFPS
jgi:TonB family protein